MNDLPRHIRTFLKNEHEVYGAFYLPEHQDISARTQPDNTPLPQSDKASGPNKPAKPEILPTQTTATGIQRVHTSGPEKPSPDSSPAQTTLPAGLNSDLSNVGSLQELRTLCEQSDVLKTDLPQTNLVFGVGPDGADLMLVGEAPGVKEDELREPFVGRAGVLLNKILESVSFRREEVYIANILKHRPPNNRDPLPAERQRSLPFLYRQIELVNPRLILCLGRVSAQTLLQTTSPMKELRGRFHPFQDNRELLVTFHPAALLRNPAWKRDTWEDVKMLRRRFEELKQINQ